MANGGVVTGPTMFPLRGGRMGLMGEAGPEAVMPLARTSDGRLGVATSGGGGNVTIVNNTGVAASAKFSRDSEGRMEIIMEAAQLGANMAESRTERSVRSGYGGLSRGLQSTYGLRRRG
jgi:phage-related minor tail protein